MISSITGKVKSINANSLVVEVGGVGVLLQVPTRVASSMQVGEEVSFHTYLIVREDALILYGFSELVDREFFELLLSVTGIGPKVAQSILANSGAASIAAAITSSDLKSLESVPGLGKKGAQRLVLELKDKAPAFADGKVNKNLSLSNQVENALQGLGYSAKESNSMLRQVMSNEKIEGLSTAQILTLALKGGGKNYMSDEISNQNADDAERVAELALRPKTLKEFVGQYRVRDQLDLLLSAARERKSPADHILFSGPPGLGKTTLAMIVAAEMDTPIRITSGPAIQHAGDLASILSSLVEGEILFLDEIHRMSRPAEEMLYLAMEDFRVDVIVGKGAGATSIPLELPHFTLVGATTRAGLLPSPLRDRFGFTAQLDFYESEELFQIIKRSGQLLDIAIDDLAISEIASRSRGTPRVANRLLRRVRDYAQVNKEKIVQLSHAQAALKIYEVDEIGLDRLDKSVLTALIKNFNGGPVGVSTLAMAVGEEIETIESLAEPFLVRLGFLARTPRGRIATAAGWMHLGIKPPLSVQIGSDATLFDQDPDIAQ
jgi:Holliday junction DNA helicase RuvB